MQIGRLAVARRGNKQVTAELEIECGQRRIVTIGRVLDPVIGHLRGALASRQIKRNTTEQGCIIGRVGGHESVEILALHCRQMGMRQGCRITADIDRTAIAGRHGHANRDGLRAAHFKLRAIRANRTAIGDNMRPRLKMQGPGNAAIGIIDTGHDKRVVIRRDLRAQSR